jgi:hypothetical protein
VLNRNGTVVQEAEHALAHAVDVIRSAPPPKDQKALKTVVRLAERVLSARIRLLKTRLKEMDWAREWNTKPMASLQHKIDGIQRSGVAGILAEFGVSDLAVVEGDRKK